MDLRSFSVYMYITTSDVCRKRIIAGYSTRNNEDRQDRDSKFPFFLKISAILLPYIVKLIKYERNHCDTLSI